MISADFSAARWAKNSYSTAAGNCVEVAFAPSAWRTSSYSSNTFDCVEVAAAERVVGVRDSKNAEGGTLVFTATQWQAFTLGLGHQ
jgi:Domain of unknown function (DUF397)